MKNIYDNFNEELKDTAIDAPLSDNAMSAIVGLVIGGVTTMFSPSATMTSRVVTAAICAVEIKAAMKKSDIKKDEGKSDLLALSGGTVTGAVTGSLSNWLLGK